MSKLPLLISTCVLLSACSRTINEITVTEEKNEGKAKETLTAPPATLEAIDMLLASPRPNLLLATMLAKVAPAAEAQAVKRLFDELSAEEVHELLGQVARDNKVVRDYFLYRGHRNQNIQAFTDGVLLKAQDGSFVPQTLVDTLRERTFNYVKNKALLDIISTFEKKANELGPDIARHLALTIRSSAPEVGDAIVNSVRNDSQQEAVHKIQGLLEGLQKADRLFRDSNLTEEEQRAVLAGGALAGTLYLLVRENNGFQGIIAKLQDFHGKAKEFAGYAKVLGDHFNSVDKDMKDLREGISGVTSGVNALMREAHLSQGVEAQRIKDFLKNQVVRNKPGPGLGANVSILSKERSINENISKTVNAVGNLSNSLGEIITLTNKMSAAFGIKLPADVNKVLQKAQQVNQTVAVAQSVMKGLASGGYMGAVSSLASMSGAMGASAEAMKLDQIDSKLNLVLENQRKMLDLQLSTMEMIKNLAIMVDNHHREQMVALEKIQDLLTTSIQLQQHQVHERVRLCELISGYASEPGRQPEFSSIFQLNFIQDKFYSAFEKTEHINQRLFRLFPETVGGCFSGLQAAFGNSNLMESPLSLLYQETGDNVGLWLKNTYAPLWDTLTRSPVINPSQLLLHMPSRTMDTITLKYDLAQAAGQGGESLNRFYGIPISVQNLERYLVNLIAFLPFLDLPLELGHETPESIVKAYLDFSGLFIRGTRSTIYLENALNITQAAIANEALIAGEPLLPLIYEEHFAQVMGTAPCQKGDLICAIRGNKLLMQNLLTFALRQQVNSFDDYERAYAARDVRTLIRMLGPGLTPARLAFPRIEEVEVAVGELKVPLPKPSELRAGQILYPERMGHLLHMQDLVLNQLEKVYPRERNNHGGRLGQLLFIGQ
jgi:uncharacterized protein YoaH (UPF0181 family)